jgi:hypothetical protein
MPLCRPGATLGRREMASPNGLFNTRSSNWIEQGTPKGYNTGFRALRSVVTRAYERVERFKDVTGLIWFSPTAPKVHRAVALHMERFGVLRHCAPRNTALRIGAALTSPAAPCAACRANARH